MKNQDNNFYKLGVNKAIDFYEKIIEYGKIIERNCGTKARMEYELGINFMLNIKMNEKAYENYKKLYGDIDREI